MVDQWFVAVVQPRFTGRALLIRYADDLVIVCTHEAEARWILEALAQRVEQYGLALHPEKTRVVPFTRPRIDPPTPPASGGPRPRSFEFLGFTPYWGTSQKGHWAVKQKTAPSQFGRVFKRIAQWCRTYRHQPLPCNTSSWSASFAGMTPITVSPAICWRFAACGMRWRGSGGSG